MKIDSPARAGTLEDIVGRTSEVVSGIGNYVSNTVSDLYSGLYKGAGSMFSSAKRTGFAALVGLALLVGCPSTQPYDDDTVGDDDDDATGDDDDTTGDDDDSTPGNESPTLYSLIFETVDGDNVVQVKDDEGQDIVYEGARILVTAEYGDDINPTAEDLPGSYVAYTTIGSRTLDIKSALDSGNYQDCSTGTATCNLEEMDNDSFHITVLEDGKVRVSYINVFEAGTLGANLFVDDGETDELEAIDSLEIRAYPGVVEGSTANYVVGSPSETVSVPYVGNVTDVSVVNGPDWVEASVGNGVIDLSSDAPDDSFYDCSEDSPCSLELEVEDDQGYVGNGSVDVVVYPAGAIDGVVFELESLQDIDGTDGTTVTFTGQGETITANVDANGNITDQNGYTLDGVVGLVPTNSTGTYTAAVSATANHSGRVNVGVEVEEYDPNNETGVTDIDIDVLNQLDLDGYTGTAQFMQQKYGTGPIYGLQPGMADGTVPITVDETGDPNMDEALEDVIFPYFVSRGAIGTEPELVVSGTGIAQMEDQPQPEVPAPQVDNNTVETPGGITIRYDFDDYYLEGALVHEFGHGIFLTPSHLEVGGIMDTYIDQGDIDEDSLNDTEVSLFRQRLNLGDYNPGGSTADYTDE